MRQKISKLTDNYFTYVGRSTLFRRFSRQFSRLLSKRDRDEVLESVYIEPADYKQRLEESLSDDIDSFRFLIGHTGIGKSTLLKSYFQITHQSPHITENNWLIIPTYCDASVSEAQDIDLLAASIVGAACRKLKTHYSIDSTDTAIIAMINSTKMRLMARSQSERRQSDADILANLFDTDKRVFFLEETKVLLNQTPISTVVLILDDIESMTRTDALASLLQAFYVIYECFQNNPQRKYRVKLLVASRPDTFRALEEKPWFNGYYYEVPLLISRIPSLVEIFKHRFNRLTKEIKDQPNNEESWMNAYEMLVRHCEAIEAVNKRTFEHLTNLNIRTAINLFEEFLSNHKWAERRDTRGDPHPAIRPEHLNTSLVSVLRAIAYGNGDKYADIDKRPIANLLKNTADSCTDLLTLYLVTHLVVCGNKEHEEGWRFVDVSRLLNHSEDIFDHHDGFDLRSHLVDMMAYLTKREVFFRKPFDAASEYDYSLAPRGEELWRLLAVNSVLLEMWREDVFMDDSAYRMEYSLSMDRTLMFEDMVKLVLQYTKREADQVSYCVKLGSLPVYVSFFGHRPIVYPLYEGLKKSVENYFKEGPPSQPIVKGLEDIRVRMEKIVPPLEKALAESKESGGAL